MKNKSKSDAVDNRNQRKQYYIKRPFQRKFILQFCSLIFLAALLIAGAVYLYAGKTVTTAFVDSRLQVMSSAEFFLPALGVIVLVVTAFISVLAAVRLLFFSHRIAGPLYRLEKSAQEIGQGNFNLHVRLRSSDELQDLASSMEQMMEDLRPRIHGIKEETEKLRSVVEKLGSKTMSAEEAAKSLQGIYERLNEQVSYFRG